MQKNQHLELKIHALNSDGHGVGRADNAVIFVEDALPGDRLRTEIVEVKKRYARGRIIELLDASPERVTPLCPPEISEFCGGCRFQNYDYAAQLRFKAQKLKEALKRIAGLDIDAVCTGANKPYFYRNKAVIPIGTDVRGQKVLGFFAVRSHRIVPINECVIQHPKCTAIIKAAERLLNEETSPRLPSQLIIRTGGEELMAALIMDGRKLPDTAKWTKALTEAGASTVLAGTKTANGENYKILAGSGYIYEQIGHIRYRIYAETFFQVNTRQAKVLYDTVLEFCDFAEDTVVIDAHAGIGGIALYLARCAAEVIGIETLPQSVKAAELNAEQNGITNTRFLCGKAEEILPELLPQLTHKAHKILVLDPPRKGCEPALLDAAIAAKIEKIIYVSCESSTLARDIKRLREGGYTVKNLRGIDMFPMTAHVECAAKLEYVHE